jgi:hypothetical protein
MSLLQSFIDENRVNVSKISFIEPIASFHEIQKITKMSFDIPLIYRLMFFNALDMFKER